MDIGKIDKVWEIEPAPDPAELPLLDPVPEPAPVPPPEPVREKEPAGA